MQVIILSLIFSIKHNSNSLSNSIRSMKTGQIDRTVLPKPFVKWVGGKRGILNELLKYIPQRINNYYEPFVGGGALFFKICDTANFSYLSDLNVDLVVTYKTIKDRPKELIEKLEIHARNHNQEYYYKVRESQELTDPIENSARFIYLMKTCFNGLWRVNKENRFNTPIGSYKNPNICDRQNILAVSNILQKAEIKYQDFSKIVPKQGDFVYFDPPYHPTAQDSFVKYVSKGFTEKDQIKLRDFALKLSKAGVKVMISNSDSDFILNIYQKDFKIQKISAPRTINRKVDKRESVFEVLITNY